MPEDPFNIVKQDIQESVVKAQTEFEAWRKAKSAAERQNLAADVVSECQSIAWQVKEMDKAVDAAERNAARFNLTQAEVASRRRWILQTNREVERLQAALQAPQQTALPSPTRRLNDAIHDENERFIGSEGQRQQQIVREQDQELDHLGESVQRIGHLGLTIHEELNQQGVMLDELDEDVEGTSARLAAAQKRINHVLAKAGMKGQMCIILFLIVVLAVLVVVAFS